MIDFSTTALITAAASLLVALTSGGISLLNRQRTDKNADELQSLKAAFDRDLEHLHSELTHGQAVSGTQWNAEFLAYQAIWKGIAEVRPLADKLVTREDDLQEIGLPRDYLDSGARLQYRQEFTQKLVTAAKRFLSAIHDNAPFYPAQIRDAVNAVHRTTILLAKKNLTEITNALKRNDCARNSDFITESTEFLLLLTDQSEKVESMIRDRLAAVKIVR